MADNEDNINSGEEDVDAQPSMKQNPTTERLKKKLKAKANMNTTTKPEKKQGLNYTAITMMVLMLAPALFALVTNVSCAESFCRTIVATCGIVIAIWH